MPRYKGVMGRTGKDGNKKAEASAPQAEEKKPRSHKKKREPSPSRDELARARFDRMAAWLHSKEAGKTPKDQDLCDCELGLRTRKLEHDLFCPFVRCFAFEIGCCPWTAVDSLDGDANYVSLAPCDCMMLRFARSPRRFKKDLALQWCTVCQVPSLSDAVWSACEKFSSVGPGRIGPFMEVGRGRIQMLPSE